MVELVGEELLTEQTREVHQVVGGDGTGNGDLHVDSLEPGANLVKDYRVDSGGDDASP
ncbi:MAG: hypothetical protein H0V67_10810 [Geodermatophilaceae bacterium]|nr:hypothetical protein [Geodermatophilaceae bacterium]